MSVQPVAAPVDPRHVTPCEIEQYGIFKEKNNERNREVCKSVNKLFDNLIQDPQMQKESLRNAYYALDESKIMHSKWNINVQGCRLLPSAELKTQLIMLKDSNPFKKDLQINNSLIFDFDTFRKQGKPYSDISFLLSDETKLWANSGMLCMKSPVFKTFFANWHKADQQEIQVKEYSAKVFDGMLSVLHGKSVEFKEWNIEEIIELVRCSEFYQISELTEACYCFLWENINAENFFSILNFAVELDKTESKKIGEQLLQRCKLFIDTIPQPEKVLHLEDSEMNELLHVLALLSHPIMDNDFLSNGLRNTVLSAIKQKLSVENFCTVCNKSTQLNCKPFRKIVHQFAKYSDHLEFIKNDEEAAEAWKKHQLYF